MIIGISGKRGSGKDTLASYFVNRPGLSVQGPRVRRVGFADPIREIAIMYFGVPRAIAYGDDRAKEAPCGKGTVRDALKAFGMCGVSIDPVVWVRHGIAEAAKCDLAFIPDVRFLWEVVAIHQAGGLVLRLTRCPIPDPHPSETALDDFNGFDCIIDNVHLRPPETAARAHNYLKVRGVVR